jgi:hypothetical protein
LMKYSCIISREQVLKNYITDEDPLFLFIKKLGRDGNVYITGSGSAFKKKC